MTGVRTLEVLIKETLPVSARREAGHPAIDSLPFHHLPVLEINFHSGVNTPLNALRGPIMVTKYCAPYLFFVFCNQCTLYLSRPPTLANTTWRRIAEKQGGSVGEQSSYSTRAPNEVSAEPYYSSTTNQKIIYK